ncbi:DUF1634 domain-containing protein [Mucilaginibacter lacusdianchii]|uniref:DUF1634 domain-containing protein n=1 Tax=Mucilaginibacter lacusdianchii TaxID=2684211 RepID=UPI00131A8E42|nr:DUF1634 domain-containing protein [Mucilaginibacter sp. JXJ CY 39]
MKKILSKSFWNDTDVEQLVGQLLRYGVIIASGIAFLGGALYIIQHGNSGIPAYSKFVGAGAGYTTYGGILKGALALRAAEIIQLGVLALIATPILRVFFSLVAFALEKDKLYVIITLVVLSVMMTSIFGGLKI